MPQNIDIKRFLQACGLGLAVLIGLASPPAWAGDRALPFSRAKFNAELEQTAVEAMPVPATAPAKEPFRFDADDLIRRAKASLDEVEAAVRQRLRVPAIDRARALGELLPATVPAAAGPEEGNAGSVFKVPPEWEADTALDDPLESLNRRIHAFNQGLVDNLFEPAAEYFFTHASPGTQVGVSNFFFNLREPITIGSALLQGDFQNAGTATARFLINSTYGVLGVYDRATEMGYARRVRTLDQTFCEYGVPSGPYFVMPVFGPSTARDTSARLATMFAQYMVLGLYVLPYRVLDTTSQYFDVRERIKFIDTLAVDSYSRYRSIYAQVTQLSCEHQPELEKELFTR
jgi:phospholipid-binding lipoprotein MlaA